MVSAYIAAKVLSPIQESKIKGIAAKRPVREPDGLHGKGKKWQMTLITGRIRKDAKGIGITATLDIIRNTGISILSIPKGIMPCSRSAMRSGVTTNKVK